MACGGDGCSAGGPACARRRACAWGEQRAWRRVVEARAARAARERAGSSAGAGRFAGRGSTTSMSGSMRSAGCQVGRVGVGCGRRAFGVACSVSGADGWVGARVTATGGVVVGGNVEGEAAPRGRWRCRLQRVRAGAGDATPRRPLGACGLSASCGPADGRSRPAVAVRAWRGVDSGSAWRSDDAGRRVARNAVRGAMRLAEAQVAITLWRCRVVRWECGVEGVGMVARAGRGPVRPVRLVCGRVRRVRGVGALGLRVGGGERAGECVP